MCDESRRFVDNHIITIDLDPETEMNIRRHERDLTLDHVQALVHENRSLYGGYIDPAKFLQALARLRPGTTPDPDDQP